VTVKKRAATPRAPQPKWTRRPEARPREILAAALRLFAERGYTATSLEDVAAAAGVTKGTIYYYFRNKETLLLRLAEAGDRERVDELEALVRDNPGSASAQLSLLIRKGFAEPTDEAQRQLHIVYLALHSDAPRLFARAIRKTLMRGWAIIVRLIERGKAAGEFRRDADAETAARVFTSGLIMQLLMRNAMGLGTRDVPNPVRMVDATIELLLHSLRPAARVAAGRGKRAAHLS